METDIETEMEKLETEMKKETEKAETDMEKETKQKVLMEKHQLQPLPSTLRLIAQWRAV